MGETPISVVDAPPQSTIAPRRAFWRRAIAWTFSPLRFARRRPRRALLIVAFACVLAVVLLALGVLLWFRQELHSARQEVERGHNTAAIRHLLVCRKIYPDHPDVLLLGARATRRSGAWDESEALLDRYWQNHGDDENVVFERVMLRAARGEIESTSTVLFAHIAQGGPNAELAREALITGLLYRYRWDETVIGLNAWLADSPDSTSALLLLGKFFDQRQRMSDAMLTFRRILTLDPEHDEARLRLAKILLDVRQGEEALVHLTYLQDRLPVTAETRVWTARALGLQGRTAEALALLDECLRITPDFPDALAERGRIAMTEGDDKTAEEYLSRVVRVDPANLAARAQYVKALSINGKNAEAAKEEAEYRSLEAAFVRITTIIQGPLQRNPNDPSLHHEIGTIGLRAGQVNDALRWFKSALEVDPNYLPTHQVLVMYYRETGNPILAAKHRAIAQKLAAQKKS